MASLSELARLVNGRVVGDGDLPITGAEVLCEAQPGQITLIDQAEKAARAGATRASAVVVPNSFVPETLPAIQVEDVHAAFTAIVAHFRPARVEPRVGISPSAIISARAQLGENVDVHPFATIGDDVRIGANSTIHSGVRIMAGCRLADNVTVFPNVVMYENTIVGPRCVIHAGAILGCYGFGYRFCEGRHLLSAQLGHVELGADVEVGAGTTIDRGTYGATTVGEGTKIDNLVMIAHNCRIGRHNMLCSQVGIAGSTTTGDYVVMAGQVGVRDHVSIGAGAVLGAMAGVTNDVPEGSRMIGIPATPEREQKIKQAALTKLPEMRRELKMLQAAVVELRRQIETHERNGKD